jgi:hypothetical protein
MIKIGFTSRAWHWRTHGRFYHIFLAVTGAWKQTFQIDRYIGSLLFSDDRQLSLNSSSFDKCLQEDQDESIYISFQIDDEWVTQDGQDLLWLPPDHRPTQCSTQFNSTQFYAPIELN